MPRRVPQVKGLRTPRSRLAFAVFAALSFLVSPIDASVLYHGLTVAGEYPPEIDIEREKTMFTLLGVIVAVPVFFTVVGLAIHNYAPVPLFIWNKKRWLWSTIWTLPLGYLAFDELWRIGILLWLYGVDYPFSLLHSLAMAYVYLVLRAALVSKAPYGVRSQPPDPAG